MYLVVYPLYQEKMITSSDHLFLVGWLDSKWNTIRVELIAMSKIVETYHSDLGLSIKH